MNLKEGKIQGSNMIQKVLKKAKADWIGRPLDKRGGVIISRDKFVNST